MTSGVLSSIFMLGPGTWSGAGSAAGTCSHSGMGSELQQAKPGYYSLEHQDANSNRNGTCRQYEHPASILGQTAEEPRHQLTKAALGMPHSRLAEQTSQHMFRQFLAHALHLPTTDSANGSGRHIPRNLTPSGEAVALNLWPRWHPKSEDGAMLAANLRRHLSRWQHAHQQISCHPHPWRRPNLFTTPNNTSPLPQQVGHVGHTDRTVGHPAHEGHQPLLGPNHGQLLPKHGRRPRGHVQQHVAQLHLDRPTLKHQQLADLQAGYTRSVSP